MIKLYEYFRSSASYRVRIALKLKGLDYEHASIHLRRGGGEQFSPEYRALNPQEMVPTLVDGGDVLLQSLAIIEYLDEKYPEPALLPVGLLEKARVRALAQVVACEMHPLNNLRVLEYLRNELKHDESEVTRWIHTWFEKGFGTLERLLADSHHTGSFCHGDSPTLADVCLVPQVASAQRFEFDLSPYPTVQRIAEACNALPAFEQAKPGKQPDAA
jgi:maleylpyruvate isomerase